MQSHVSILGTGRIAQAIGIDVEGVDGAEMSLDGTKFLLVHQVEEARFELTDLAGRGRYGHSLLSTSQQDMILLLRYDSIVHRSVRLVRLQVFQINDVVQLGGEVGRGSDEQGLVLVEGDPVDLLFVGEDLLELFAGDGIVKADGPIVEGNEEGLVHVEPNDVGGVDALAVGHFGQIDLQPRSVGIVFRVVILGNVVDGYLRIVLHERVGDGGIHLRPLGKGDAADRTVVGEVADALSGLAVPQPDGGIGAGRKDPAAEPIDVEVPNGTLVAVEGADAVAILGAPHGWDMVLAAGEEQIAVVVELDDGDGSLVTLEKNWSLVMGRGVKWEVREKRGNV